VVGKDVLEERSAAALPVVGDLAAEGLAGTVFEDAEKLGACAVVTPVNEGSGAVERLARVGRGGRIGELYGTIKHSRSDKTSPRAAGVRGERSEKVAETEELSTLDGLVAHEAA